MSPPHEVKEFPGRGVSTALVRAWLAKVQEVLQPSVALQTPPRLICDNVSGRVFYWDV